MIPMPAPLHTKLPDTFQPSLRFMVSRMVDASTGQVAWTIECGPVLAQSEGLFGAIEAISVVMPEVRAEMEDYQKKLNANSFIGQN